MEITILIYLCGWQYKQGRRCWWVWCIVAVDKMKENKREEQKKANKWKEKCMGMGYGRYFKALYIQQIYININNNNKSLMYSVIQTYPKWRAKIAQEIQAIDAPHLQKDKRRYMLPFFSSLFCIFFFFCLREISVLIKSIMWTSLWPLKSLLLLPSHRAIIIPWIYTSFATYLLWVLPSSNAINARWSLLNLRVFKRNKSW